MDIYISKLEAKKLLMDLKYWKEELNIKKEIVNNLDVLFNQEIETYLKDNINTKQRWDDYLKSLDSKIENLVKNDSDSESVSGIDIDMLDEKSENDKYTQEEKGRKVKETKDPFLKHLYREIVKKTHPDKNKNLPEKEKDERTEIYKECTKAYDNDNIVDLLYYADSLNIDFELKDLKIISNLKENLQNIKNMSSYLENTYTWKWYNADDKIRKSIMSMYIEQTLK